MICVNCKFLSFLLPLVIILISIRYLYLVATDILRTKLVNANKMQALKIDK